MAMMFGLSFLPMAGAVGVAVDLNRANRVETIIQELADHAALAGAYYPLATRQSQELYAEAHIDNFKSDSDFQLSEGGTVIKADKAKGTVTVELNGKMPLTLSRVIMDGFGAEGSFDIKVKAVAVSGLVGGGTACVLALEENTTGINFGGNADITANGCRFVSNSSADDAINFQNNNTHLTSECLISAGGVDGSTGLNTTTSCAEVTVTNAPTTADPYAAIPHKTKPSGPCQELKVTNGQTKTLQPNTNYCNVTVTGGTLNVLPGDIYIQGNMNVNGGHVKSVSSGSEPAGNMFFLENGAVTLNGNGTTNLRSSATGSYSGMLFFGGRDNSSTATFNGTANTDLNGVAYFPGATVKITGNFEQSGTQCLQIVANAINFSGNVSFESNCEAFGVTAINAATLLAIRLMK
jgi:hypothetical protein